MIPPIREYANLATGVVQKIMTSIHTTQEGEISMQHGPLQIEYLIRPVSEFHSRTYDEPSLHQVVGSEDDIHHALGCAERDMFEKIIWYVDSLMYVRRIRQLVEDYNYMLEQEFEDHRILEEERCDRSGDGVVYLIGK